MSNWVTSVLSVELTQKHRVPSRGWQLAVFSGENSKTPQWTLRHLLTPYRSEGAAQPTHLKSDFSPKFYFPQLLLTVSSQGGEKKKKKKAKQKQKQMKKNCNQKHAVLPSLEKSNLIHQITTLSKWTLSCPWICPTYSHESPICWSNHKVTPWTEDALNKNSKKT